ncbi:hypothetical protein GCM10007424_23750 [Flavobacterium suaedae]|uniref:DUF5675 domain-containing protein n=1 Tax=Flavobacterium suaedae TaxID=1767027 RepID=A0ABQ1K2I7_9FLAO|nr:DUF5675 family protein [Flavobacterium suaedae]GGB82974.1 hypothetical protein GCM10007424_23750 [Flavobacterium suaedae]
MMEAILKRQQSDDKQTLGTLEVFDKGRKVFECKTLELDWQNNKRRESCIPVGVYNVVTRTSAKYGLHYHVTNVPARSFILIHHGNYNKDILGCILVGSAHIDINGDGYKDVTNSRNTLKKLLKASPNGFTLTIQ